MITLEISAHRFGGADTYARDFGPTTAAVSETGVYSIELTAQTTASQYVRLTLSDWTRVDDEWQACVAHLEDVNGYPLGRRPVLVFDRPYDIPTHTNFGSRHPDAGAFVLGFRKVGSKT